MTTSEVPRSAFRCTVVPENSAACLKVGWHCFSVRVLDTSREAFTLEVHPQAFRQIKEGTRACLEFNGEVWEVQCTAVFQLANGQFSISMARNRDVTRISGPKASWLTLLPVPNPTANPILPLALLLSFLFACIALPGMGDQLGTAPKIRTTIQNMWRATTGR